MNSHSHLPESLQAQLNAARRRLWIVETVVAVLGGLCGLLVAYLLLFVSDRFWETPMPLRIASTAIGVVGAAIGAWWWASHYTRRSDPRLLAQLVQRRFRRFGDRLLSVVELADTERRPPNVSERLIDAAMDQVAIEAQKLDFKEAVPTRSLKRWMPAFVVVAVLGAAALIIAPSAGRNTLIRWLKPAAEVERYTFTKLEKLEPRRVVPFGEPFTVQARLKKDSEWTPPVGRARVERQSPVGAPERKGAYAFSIPGQTRTGLLAVAVGDARDATKIEPAFRPDLSELKAEVSFPEYLQYPPQPLDVLSGSLEVVEGSQASFSGRVSRALQSATVEVAEGAADGAKAAIEGDRFTSTKIPFNTPTNQVSFAWRDQLGLEGRHPFNLNISTKPDAAPTIDCTGLRRTTAILEDEVLSVPIRAEDDFGVKQAGLTWEYTETMEGPTAKKGALDIPEKGGPQTHTLEGAGKFAPSVLGIGPGRVSLVATANDFHPKHTASTSSVYTVFILDKAEHARLVQREMERLQGRMEDIVRAEEQQLDNSRRLQEMTPDELNSKKATQELREAAKAESENRAQLRRLREDFEKLSKEALRNSSIPEQQLSQMSEMSQQASNVEQQEMKNAEQSLQNAAQKEPTAEQQKKMEELLKKMQELQKKIEELQKQAPSDQQKQQLGQMQQQMQQMQQQMQQANAQQMQQMQQQMQQMQQQMQQMQQGAQQQQQQQMQQAQQMMQQMQQQMKEMQQRAQELQKATEEQQKALEKLREAMQKLAKANEEMMADNFANRLRNLAKSEKGLTTEIAAVLPSTVGLRFEDMPAPIKEKIQGQEALQRQSQKRTKAVTSDMESYLKRVPNEQVTAVRLEMEQTNVVDRLGGLADLLTANKLVQAQQEAGQWEKQFLAWADMLKKPAKKNDGKGKGKGQQKEQKMSPEMMEFLISLLRIRQQEQDLRDSTRVLDERKETDKAYPERAKGLASKQEEITNTFREAPKKAGVSEEELQQMYEFLDAVEFAMDDAHTELARPETGGPAIGAETEVIELLSPQEEQQDPKTGKPKPGQMSAQMKAMMQQLQQQMGMQSGKKPGPMGSFAGGQADQASKFERGKAGQDRGEREIEKAGGRDVAAWPTEYRDALEGYFKAVEAEQK